MHARHPHRSRRLGRGAPVQSRPQHDFLDHNPWIVQLAGLEPHDHEAERLQRLLSSVLPGEGPQDVLGRVAVLGPPVELDDDPRPSDVDVHEVAPSTDLVPHLGAHITEARRLEDPHQERLLHRLAAGIAGTYDLARPGTPSHVVLRGEQLEERCALDLFTVTTALLLEAVEVGQHAEDSGQDHHRLPGGEHARTLHTDVLQVGDEDAVHDPRPGGHIHSTVAHERDLRRDQGAPDPDLRHPHRRAAPRARRPDVDIDELLDRPDPVQDRSPQMPHHRTATGDDRSGHRPDRVHTAGALPPIADVEEVRPDQDVPEDADQFARRLAPGSLPGGARARDNQVHDDMDSKDHAGISSHVMTVRISRLRSVDNLGRPPARQNAR